MVLGETEASEVSQKAQCTLTHEIASLPLRERLVGEVRMGTRCRGTLERVSTSRASAQAGHPSRHRIDGSRASVTGVDRESDARWAEAGAEWRGVRSGEPGPHDTRRSATAAIKQIILAHTPRRRQDPRKTQIIPV